ncbi:MAG: DUF1501 domain-containing protein [Planctomycetaceae bacterium]
MPHESLPRRTFLRQGAFGLGPLALTWMLDRDRAFANPPKPALEPLTFDTLPKPPRAAARATAMISLWMQGGPSHHDLFDPKPEMAKWDGQPFPGEIQYDNAAQASSKVFATPWKFVAPIGADGTVRTDPTSRDRR